MEFKTAYPLLAAGTGGNFGVFLVVTGVLLVLLSTDLDRLCRAALTLAVNCVKALLTGVAHWRGRPSSRPRRRR
ncbi:hypothetical protein [Amycolatopsis sp. H20-H5]|uniref:hypothetical protein n=1 Tax=Amycolatopsis sp. H20-H5 TaxID=3046309 RepID=UPI002DB5F5DC|nr:hypothetical protein [Amycolatopsis sp. H20-H5]MEC3982388.1 hypothetical protein [Amycolatopsis sp. H20-H5]